MRKSIKLDYSRLEADYAHTLGRLFARADLFYTVATRAKPYSHTPPLIRQAAFDAACSEFIIDRVFQNDIWPAEIEKSGKKKLLLAFRADRRMAKAISDLGNPFVLNEALFPEDMYFYRNGKLWFYAITHEKLAFARIENANDRDLFI